MTTRISKLERAKVGIVATGLVVSIATGQVAVGQAADGDWAAVAAGISDSGGQKSSSIPVDGTTFVLPSSGVEIVIGEAVTADDPAVGDVQDQVIVSTPNGLAAVAVFEGERRPAETIDAYVGGFGESMDSVDEVDRKEQGSSATGIYRVDTGSEMLYMFISVDSASIPGFTLVEVMLADAPSMADSIVLTRENVFVDGMPMFTNVDEAEVGDIVLADAG